MPVFIFEHRTPKQVRLIAAKELRGLGPNKGYAYKAAEVTYSPSETRPILVALAATRRDSLKEAYEVASVSSPHLFANTSFSPAQSNGRPPMVTVK